mmetsp:Transcript_11596/g.45061  ORF Transcript_11596/g.45061 Transcript_11596/m.45061 type:complete len:267 (-) Transcript_11596:1480-2280(-)
MDARNRDSEPRAAAARERAWQAARVLASQPPLLLPLPGGSAAPTATSNAAGKATSGSVSGWGRVTSHWTLRNTTAWAASSPWSAGARTGRCAASTPWGGSDGVASRTCWNAEQLPDPPLPPAPDPLAAKTLVWLATTSTGPEPSHAAPVMPEHSTAELFSQRKLGHGWPPNAADSRSEALVPNPSPSSVRRSELVEDRSAEGGSTDVIRGAVNVARELAEERRPPLLTATTGCALPAPAGALHRACCAETHCKAEHSSSPTRTVDS